MENVTDPVNVKKTKYQDVNALSKLFFFWIIPTFKRGFKHDLTEKDLVDIGNMMDSSLLGDKFETAWLHELSYRKSPLLWRALFMVIRKDLLMTGILFALTEAARLCQPILLAKYLEYFNPQSVSTKAEAYEYAAYLTLSIFSTVIFYNFSILCFLFFGLKLKVAADSLLYRKVLQLSKPSLAEVPVGKIVNLFSNDTTKLYYSLMYVHLVWLAPLEIGVITYLTYYFFGLCAIIGSMVFILSVPFQAWISKLVYLSRIKAASETDSRLKLMNDIILGIKVIKMYTWEKAFAKLISQQRKEEIKQLLKVNQLKAILLSLNTWLSRMAMYFAVVSYVMLGGVATAQFIFTLDCFYNILRVQVANALAQGVTGAAETAVTANRLANFLQLHETEECPKPEFVRVEEKGVWINNATAKWASDASELSLFNINFEVAGPKLVAIMGPVGCGKTTLLHLILKELRPIDGSVTVKGKLSYASQEPWLFDATIRDNIIFGHAFNDVKYQDVVHVCALDRDLSLLPYGDETLVGERGIMLSGGQKARINLARAVYAEADIYLLDDPLSAVDAGVANHIFEQCICKYLKNRCVIVAMHQLHYVDKVDRVCFMRNGSFTTQSDLEIILSNDRNTQGYYKHIDYCSIPQSPVGNKEHMASGAVSNHVYALYGKAAGKMISVVVLVNFIGVQILTSFADYFLGMWANFNQWKEMSNSTYHEEPHWPTFITNYCDSLVLYSSLIVLIMAFAIIRNAWFFKACLRTSLRLYNRMFEKLCDADMLFFFRNSSGRILNRVSHDVGIMDEVVPIMMFFTVQVVVSIFGIISITSILNIWTVVPILILFTLFYILHLIFLRTNTNLQRMDAITKSHTIAHLTATLQGLTTIRAFGAQQLFMKTFDAYENRNTTAFFLFLCANRAYGVWTDLLCSLHISILITTLIFIKETSSANVGMLVTQSMTLLTLFQWGLRQWGELATQMTSVERVKEYIDIEPEKDDNVEEQPPDWPEMGVLEFRNVSLRYSLENPYVIKNINFLIKSEEKVGIVGRTGSGKTSLINALFRLLRIDGQILIDNVDIKKLPLGKVRSSISIIPQDPVMFAGSIRNNLDPFGEYQDEVLWKTLEDVNLKPLVTQMDNGLESCMSEGGLNFSVGQRQLLCLARALLRKNKILVLDEATANVDLRTDALIQSTIRTKFCHCTVLVVAHRLHTIMDSHRIMVMDEGVLREFDHPYVLLQNQIGIFRELVDQMGVSVAEDLETIAKQNLVGLHADE